MHIVAAAAAPALSPADVRARSLRARLAAPGAAVGLVALVTVVGFALRARLQPTDVAMLYLLAVVVVAAQWRFGPALLASVLGLAAFDFLFVPPYYTFEVLERAYLLTFAVMLVVAFLMSRLTARVREQAEEAREREARTAAQYALSTELDAAATSGAATSIVARHVAIAAQADVVVALSDDGADDGDPAWPDGGAFDSVDVRVAATWAHQHGEPAGFGTAHCTEAEALVLPLRTATRRLGVVIVTPAVAERWPDPTGCRMAAALVEGAALALQRALLDERHDAARLEVEAERLRTALLSSLSHDLRTPLASIEGAASSLLQDTAAMAPDVRRDLAEAILVESRRMTRLVANLLDMVRVESGTLTVRKAWQPLEEALGVALLRLDEPLRDHPLTTSLPGDLPLVPIDELLIEQVFINLLENAAKYTPAGTPLAVRAWPDGEAVVVEVADRGPGLAAGDEAAVFRKFYRGDRDGDGGAAGAGLGLTICRGIVMAHGGRIWAAPRDGGGAAFRFTLPLDGPPVAARLAPLER